MTHILCCAYHKITQTCIWTWFPRKPGVCVSLAGDDDRSWTVSTIWAKKSWLSRSMSLRWQSKTTEKDLKMTFRLKKAEWMDTQKVCFHRADEKDAWEEWMRNVGTDKDVKAGFRSWHRFSWVERELSSAEHCVSLALRLETNTQGCEHQWVGCDWEKCFYGDWTQLRSPAWTEGTGI